MNEKQKNIQNNNKKNSKKTQSNSVTVYDAILLYCKSLVGTPITRFWQRIFNILCEDVHAVVDMPSSGCKPQPMQ